MTKQEMIGQALQQLKILFPDKSAAERADMLTTWDYKTLISSNGK